MNNNKIKFKKEMKEEANPLHDITRKVMSKDTVKFVFSLPSTVGHLRLC